jgi:hypothetical protein
MNAGDFERKRIGLGAMLSLTTMTLTSNGFISQRSVLLIIVKDALVAL